MGFSFHFSFTYFRRGCWLQPLFLHALLNLREDVLEVVEDPAVQHQLLHDSIRRNKGNQIISLTTSGKQNRTKLLHQAKNTINSARKFDFIMSKAQKTAFDKKETKMHQRLTQKSTSNLPFSLRHQLEFR